MDFMSNNGYEENNYDDIDKQVHIAYQKRQQKRKDSKLADEDFLDEIIEANEINKRVIGKVIIKYCGHEGTQNDKRTASLRKLLQAVIDYMQNNPKQNWKNAEVTIYDLDDNSIRISSGEGKHQYVVSDAGDGRAEIVNTSNKVHKVKHVKAQPNHEKHLEKRPTSRTSGFHTSDPYPRPMSRPGHPGELPFNHGHSSRIGHHEPIYTDHHGKQHGHRVESHNNGCTIS